MRDYSTIQKSSIYVKPVLFPVIGAGGPRMSKHDQHKWICVVRPPEPHLRTASEHAYFSYVVGSSVKDYMPDKPASFELDVGPDHRFKLRTRFDCRWIFTGAADDLFASGCTFVDRLTAEETADLGLCILTGTLATKYDRTETGWPQNPKWPPPLPGGYRGR